jgi:2-iminobutanoate/2-iminopropanoate deaminase
MCKRTFEVDGLPKGGPYSHAVEAGGFLFVSGMVPIDLENNRSILDDIREATRLVLNNVRKVLRTAGYDMEHVVKVTVFLRDMEDFTAMNEVYGTFFPKERPARSCVAVKQLPGNFPIEIEVVAAK